MTGDAIPAAEPSAPAGARRRPWPWWPGGGIARAVVVLEADRHGEP